jgi:hypothetical protein
MRALADVDRIRRFMRALGSAADEPARVYLTGGATAVLIGWRASTIDVDLRVEPDRDAVFRAIDDPSRAGGALERARISVRDRAAPVSPSALDPRTFRAAVEREFTV